MTLTEIRAALESRGLRPLKQLGQNFLHDQNLAKWLADHAAAGRARGHDGGGNRPRPRRADLVAAREKPARDRPRKRPRALRFPARDNSPPKSPRGQLDLREGDALDVLPRLGVAPTVICGNLPYYISTPLLMECLRLPGPPARLFFLVQKEVGQRLAGAPGNKTYGSLSVLVQAGYEVELARTLPGSVFYPPPEVESVAVQLTPRRCPLVQPAERASFATVVQRGFSQRRKKLSNLLEVKDDRRAEALAPAEWVELWRRLVSAQAQQQ